MDHVMKRALQYQADFNFDREQHAAKSKEQAQVALERRGSM